MELEELELELTELGEPELSVPQPIKLPTEPTAAKPPNDLSNLRLSNDPFNLSFIMNSTLRMLDFDVDIDIVVLF